MSTPHHDLRPFLALAACLGVALCVRLTGALAGGRTGAGRAQSAAAAAGTHRSARQAGPRTSRIPLLSRLLGSLGARPEVEPEGHPRPQLGAALTNGGWTLAECLADQRRPGVESEMRALTARGDAALPLEMARTLALAAADREYQDALARAAAMQAAPAEALAVLEEAFSGTPEQHRVARLRLLEAMLPLARACRPLSHTQVLAGRMCAERAALIDLAAAAGLVTADEARAARDALDETRGLHEAVEPLLAGLLARGRTRDGEAD